MASDAMVGVEETRSEPLRESRAGDKDIAERPWKCGEKLVLLCAVLKHGDQAWTAVSRAMRAHFAQEERHQAVFSPKRCAEVHAELVDTDQKSVAEKFALERMKELKQALSDKEKLAKQYSHDIVLIKSGKMDSQLQAIIDEPISNYAQAAFYLQSPPEKKRSKKARGDSNVESPAAPDAQKLRASASSPVTGLSASTSAASTPAPSLAPRSPSLRNSQAPLSPKHGIPSSPLASSTVSAPRTPTAAVPPSLAASFATLSSSAVSDSIDATSTAAPSSQAAKGPGVSTPSPTLRASASLIATALPLTPEEQKRKLRDSLLKVLLSMEKRGPHAQFFQQPVPLDDAPEYDQVIKQRMDFDQVRTRIDALPGYGVWEFYRDMLLIFTNALTYNEPGSLVYTVAAQMKRSLEKEIEPLLAEARGRTAAAADEKGRRSARVKEERKWHGE